MKKTIIIMLCIQALFAQVPHKMSFQAYLTDSNNMPVAPGTYEITFRIYDAKTDGNKIWEETQTVNVDGSMVNAMLGSTIPLVPIEKSGYLEIQLKDDILSPRQEIGTSMFSLQAHKAVRADIADSAPGYAKLDTLSFYAKTGDIVANTDNQSLSLSGDSLYISNGNGVSLNQFKDTFTDTDTDDQSLRISGDTLYISEGNAVSLASYKDTFTDTDTDDQSLRISGDSLYISEGNAVSLASYKDTFTDTDTDDQSLRISGDTLYISEGNAVSLANYKDNADTQDLSIAGNTISLVDGGSVDVSAATAVVANTAKTGITSDQASAIVANTGKTGITTDQATAITNNTAKVGVPTAYSLPSTDGSSSQVLQTDGSGAVSWATVSGGGADTQDLSISGNTISLVDGGSVDVSAATAVAANTAKVGVPTSYTLPSADGSSSQVLQTDGSGTVSWATASSGGASNVTGLTDALVEDNSLYIGNDPSATTSTAEYNVAVGTTALDAITSGDYNVAVGAFALTANTTGQRNTASGYKALSYNTTGQRNTASGMEALSYNTTGGYNTATGFYALRSNTTGGYNTANGYGAGDLITTGSNNVLIGSGADPSANNASNQVVIGYNATGAGDNTVQLGNTSITNVKTSGTITAGAITIPNTDGTNGQVLQTDGSGTLSWATASGGGASNVNGLSDGLVEDNSLYIGNDPSSTTSTAQYNVAVGSTALDAVTTGDNNAAVGYNALTSNTTGYGNTAVGTNSLEKNTTGFNNTATGKSSLYNNTTGTANTASGYASLYSNSTGSNNIATGYYALLTNSTGSSNTATGYAALRDNTIGENNTATGTSTLRSNTTGGQNTAFGQGGMVSVTTGSYNSSLGYSAGDLITTGSNNVIIGSGADPSANNATNQIVIGYNATGTGDNTVQLGNTSITDVHTSGDVNAVAFNTSSDKRLKTNIAPLKVALAKVLKLNPVQYEKKRALDAKEYTLNEMGFLAQDVQKILPNVVKEGEDKDKLLSVNYIEIIPVLTKAIQEQQAQIEALQNQLQVLVAMQTQDGNTVESTEGDQ